MSELSQAELFPLIRGGGLFLLVAGASMVLGAFYFRARYLIFGLGAGVGAALTASLAARLAAPFGPPDMIQIGSLVVAVALEVVVLALALRARKTYDDRETMLVVLTIVGGHFALMAPAFGPLVMLLAGASVVNTLIALLWRAYPSVSVWTIDGILKTVVGALMFYAQELPCTMCINWQAP
jgi:hypothetical protein